MKTYTPQEQLDTNITLEPIKCPKCGSLETVYNQYAHIVNCQDCGAEYRQCPHENIFYRNLIQIDGEPHYTVQCMDCDSYGTIKLTETDDHTFNLNKKEMKELES